MGSRTVLFCDWCKTEPRTTAKVYGTDWPVGWSHGEDDDLLCDKCSVARKEALTAAKKARIAAEKESTDR